MQVAYQFHGFTNIVYPLILHCLFFYIPVGPRGGAELRDRVGGVVALGGEGVV